MKKKWISFQERIAVFFEEVQRTGADIKHEIRVIKTDKYHDFIEFIINSPKVSTKYKLMIVMQLSTASRVSEMLHIKKKDLDIEKSIVGIKVLKKRLTKEKNGVTCSITPKIRYAVIDQSILPLLKEWVADRSDGDYIFSNPNTGKPYSREGVWMQYQDMLGSTTHGFRHSRINYYFEEQDFTVEEVANSMLFSNREVAYTYNNTNQKKAALKLVEKEKLKKAA